MVRMHITVKNKGKSMHKLLALDLDGTVLNSQHKISPTLVETIKNISQNVHVVIVTGRHHVAAEPYYRELNLDTPIICCNGTYTYDYANDAIITENAINKNIAKKFISLSEDRDLKMVMYVRDAMLYSKNRPIQYMEKLSSWAQSFPANCRPNIKKINDFSEELNYTDYIWKFVVEGGDIESFLNIEFVKNNFIGERSWVDRVDFSALGNSKGNALSAYIQQLGISLEECVAIGDNHNDISMLSIVGRGIAMKNADQAVKESASIVTAKTNDDEKSLATLIQSIF